MALTNLSFETAGGNPGEASGWTIVIVAAQREYAGFSTPEVPFENFERGWSSNENYIFIFTNPMLSAALFDPVFPENVEDFNEGWEVVGGGGTGFVQAVFDTIPENFEDFEEDWSSNQNYKFVFVPLDLSAALFDTVPEAVEDYEENWRFNESYKFSFVPLDLSAALFDGATEAFENFENAWVETL